MVWKIIGGLAGAIIIAFGLGFILPSQVHVERSLVINATPGEIFPLISDLNRWDAWSPWANLDPDADLAIKGRGVGQTMEWHSENPEVGQGLQEVIGLEPPNVVTTHLDFGDQGMADATLQLTPQGNGTLVSWMLDTDMRAGVPTLQQPISTYFQVFMDGMIGGQYEQGLENLKAVVEQ